MAPREPARRSRVQPAEPAAPVPAETLAQRLARWLQETRQQIVLLLTIAGVCLLLYFVVFGRDGVAAYLQKRNQAQQLQQQMQTLQRENQQLTQHNQRLLNDPDAIEDAARKQLHYARPGEVIYTLPEDPGAQDDAAQKPAK